MNTQIRRLTLGLMAMYVALFVTLNYWQVGRQEELRAYPSNNRALIRQFDQPRGPILTADGVEVARSVMSPPEVDSDVRFQREYPTGDLFSQVVGYHTFGLGSTKLENTLSDVLVGDTPTQQVRAIEGYLGQTSDNSGQVVLTMRDDLQRVAKFLLGDREGSVVLMEPQTGAIRAMFSYPSYDPNLVVTPDYDAAYEHLRVFQEDDRDPLLGNAFQQRYMPGSTFKVLTTGAALDAGKVDLQSTWPSEREWIPPQTQNPISNYRGTECGGDLTEVFTRSCNIPFAQMAVDMGPDLFRERIDRWGVGQAIPIDVPGAASSTIGSTEGLGQQLPLLAMRGFGQNEDQMVPLHMAMVASTVAAEGAMMKPYVVEATLDHDGNVINRHEPEVWKYPISRGTSAVLRDLMTQVAVNGTASCCIALDGGISVAAKTGTAQLNGPGEPERSHAWIIAFAPVERPKFAVAVMIKGTNAEISASTGGQLAGPIAKAMLDEAFKVMPPDAQVLGSVPPTSVGDTAGQSSGTPPSGTQPATDPAPSEPTATQPTPPTSGSPPSTPSDGTTSPPPGTTSVPPSPPPDSTPSPPGSTDGGE